MKAAPFDFIRGVDLEHVCAELAADPADTKVIAGGQSLIPMLALRLARPGRLIDINDLPLSAVRTEPSTIAVGATVRHAELATNHLGGPIGNLLAAAGSQIGHHPIRTRGTFGGSIAHSDAASEWCLVAALLDARMTVVSAARGRRTIDAADFFVSLFTTTMEPDEILLEIELPALDGRWSTGLAEYARRAGDFGIVTVATALEVVDGTITGARVAIGGVSDTPFRSADAQAVLLGAELTVSVLEAAGAAAADEVDPPTDAHGSSDYRRGLVRALLPRSARQMAILS